MPDRSETPRVLFTGGATGIGAATAARLAAAGAEVTILDVAEPDHGAGAFVRCDLSDPAAIDAALETQPGPWSALVNVAGIPGPRPAEPQCWPGPIRAGPERAADPHPAFAALRLSLPTANGREEGIALSGAVPQGAGLDIEGGVMAGSTVPLVGAVPATATADDHLRLMLFGGALLLLINLAAPMHGLIGVPVAFFLKNRLHLSANQLAVFNLWVGAPLFAGFVFGFLRDRWSPFRAGDRGHIVLFGLATMAIYLIMAFAPPSYGALLACLLTATITFQMIASAASGLVTAIGQREAMAGGMSMVLGVAVCLPVLAAYLLGGYVSGWLEGRGADSAARILFLGAAALMGAIALLGAVGPKGFFARGAVDRHIATAWADFVRLLRHWPVYPVMLIQLFWQFAPAQGIVLQYHITNALHASDAQWGVWNAIFYGAFIPVYLAYGFLCRRVRLRWLLWVGFTIAVAQMVPLLFIRSAEGALLAALPMGLLGGLGQAALVDLTIRAAPKGLQGTMIMLFTACFWISGRFGDVFGTWLYDQHGGFVTAVIATIVVYALILPLLLLVPGRLTATRDGEAAVDGGRLATL